LPTRKPYVIGVKFVRRLATLRTVDNVSKVVIGTESCRLRLLVRYLSAWERQRVSLYQQSFTHWSVLVVVAVRW
jgi:hypothetical protein